MELKGKKVVFLGDSITEGAGAEKEENIYHQVFKRNCELKAAPYDGIGGTRIARQKKASEESKFDRDFISRADALDDDADAVVVFGGTNDFGHGDAPLGKFDDRTEYTFYGACHVLMEKLINKYPDIPIVFITPLHRQSEKDAYPANISKNVSLRDYVYAIKEVAEYYSIPVLDLYAQSGMQPCVEAQNKMYFADGLHPNPKGHARVAEKLENFMRQL